MNIPMQLTWLMLTVFVGISSLPAWSPTHCQHNKQKPNLTHSGTKPYFWKQNATQTHCWCMSGIHGQGRNLYHHMKNHLWSSLKFSLAEKPTNCEGESYPIHHGKTTRPNNKIFTSTENIPTETFRTKYWNNHLGGVSVYTPTDWHLTKSWTIHHHSWRHPTLWTPCWSDKNVTILKITQTAYRL